jgi:hypothetical protein
LRILARTLLLSRRTVDLLLGAAYKFSGLATLTR